MTHLTNAGLMLGQRRRRWTIIEPALVKYVVFILCVWIGRTGICLKINVPENKPLEK